LLLGATGLVGGLVGGSIARENQPRPYYSRRGGFGHRGHAGGYYGRDSYIGHAPGYYGPCNYHGGCY
jgi:hypothetical protein